MIRVLLADPHRLLLPAIRALLATSDDMILVGEATNSHELRQNCQECHPDILLLSPNLVDSCSEKLLTIVKEQCPAGKIIIMLSDSEEICLTQLADLGVNGFFLKSDAPEKLLEAIDAVSQGKPWFSLELLSQLVQSRLPNKGRDVTDREIEILRLLVLEKTNTEIAQALNLAERTVRAHLENIYSKLGVSSRVGAAVQAIRLNLISDQSSQ